MMVQLGKANSTIRRNSSSLTGLFNSYMVRIGIRGSKDRDRHNHRRIAASEDTLQIQTNKLELSTF